MFAKVTNSLIDAEIRSLYQSSRNRTDLSAGIQNLCSRFGLTPRQVSRRGNSLGVARAYKPWSPEQDAELRDMAGEKSVAYIARRMGRSRCSVKNRLFVLNLSGRVSVDGYQYKDISGLLGVSQTTVVIWVRKGWLRTSPNGTVTEDTLRAFLVEHFDLISLKRVDEQWLKLILRDFFARAARRQAVAA